MINGPETPKESARKIFKKKDKGKERKGGGRHGSFAISGERNRPPWGEKKKSDSRNAKKIKSILGEGGQLKMKWITTSKPKLPSRGSYFIMNAKNHKRVAQSKGKLTLQEKRVFVRDR